MDIKKQIETIWRNKTIYEFDALFAYYSKYWINTAIIYIKSLAIVVLCRE